MKTKPEAATKPADETNKPATESAQTEQQTPDNTALSAETTQAPQGVEKPQAEPERRPERGPIERTVARMIDGWLDAERKRGYLTADCEDDARKAIQQLAGA